MYGKKMGMKTKAGAKKGARGVNAGPKAPKKKGAKKRTMRRAGGYGR